jgi:uridine phosphorylase
VHPNLPLLEFDADPSGLIEPQPLATTAEVPEHAVICFFQEVIDEVCGDGRAERIGAFRWAHRTHPLYRLRVQDHPIAVFYPGVGAPLACGLLEDAIASGCSRFVACGGAGAIVPGMALGHVIGPSSAVRDEGTRAKIRARRAEGCLTVEMETAAFLAVARHRGVRLAQYLYAGDDASGETWDHRRWHTSSARRELFWLAASAVLRL